MQQAAAYFNLEVYEDSVNLLGVAKVTLPSIDYLTVPISGAGIMGNLNVPLMGTVDSMEMSLEFLSMTQAAAMLAKPKKHQLDLRVAEEFWETEEAEAGIWFDKFVVICQPKGMTPGAIAPFTAGNVSGKYEVYYFAAYRDGEQLWEIDKRNMKCVVGGADYWADVRKALGK